MTDASVLHDGGCEEPSSTLLARARARQPDGWQRLVYLYAPVVYGWCRSAGLQEADAADVGQDVFQAVFGAIERFRRRQEGDSFRAWLWTIAQNKIVDFARRKRPGGDGVGGSDAQARIVGVAEGAKGDEDTETPAGEELVLFRRAVELVLSDCKPETRQAFLRVVAGDQNPEDVARDLGISVNAVYLARSRLKRRIREEFDGLLEM